MIVLIWLNHIISYPHFSVTHWFKLSASYYWLAFPFVCCWASLWYLFFIVATPKKNREVIYLWPSSVFSFPWLLYVFLTQSASQLPWNQTVRFFSFLANLQLKSGDPDPILTSRCGISPCLKDLTGRWVTWVKNNGGNRGERLGFRWFLLMSLNIFLPTGPTKQRMAIAPTLSSQVLWRERELVRRSHGELQPLFLGVRSLSFTGLKFESCEHARVADQQ